MLGCGFRIVNYGRRRELLTTSRNYEFVQIKEDIIRFNVYEDCDNATGETDNDQDQSRVQR